MNEMILVLLLHFDVNFSACYEFIAPFRAFLPNVFALKAIWLKTNEGNIKNLIHERNNKTVKRPKTTILQFC